MKDLDLKVPRQYPTGFKEHGNLGIVDFVRDGISPGVILAEPLPYTFRLEGNDAALSEFQQDLHQYQDHRQQAFPRTEDGDRLCAIDTSQCCVVNNILKTVLFNTQIASMDELQRIFPEVFEALNNQSEDQQRLETNVLNQIFRLVDPE